MIKIIIDIIGWVGSFVLIAAYFQNSRNKINAQSTIYQLANVIGSLCLIINTVYYGAYPSSAVNIIWVFIGIHFLIKYTKNATPTH
jgi:hypothetical protein